MRQVQFRGHSFSQLVLGTAQFGLRYGIANQVGQPSYQNVLKILERAFEAGVNALDTAALYGESELVLGRALRDLGVRHQAFIVSKFPWVKLSEGECAQQFLEKAISRSLENLGLDQIPLCLFHRYGDLPYLEAALRLREKGLIGHTGVSVYGPTEAMKAMAMPGIEAIQHPTSLLDQRFYRQGLIESAHKREVAIFARSIYLQGALIMPTEHLPDFLRGLEPVCQKLARIAGNDGLTSLALRFVGSLPGVVGVLAGQETLQQLESNLAASKKGNLDGDTLEQIQLVVPDLPESLVDTRQWQWNRPYDWIPQNSKDPKQDLEDLKAPAISGGNPLDTENKTSAKNH